MVDLVYINSTDPPFKQAVDANNNFSTIETSINSTSSANIVDATTVGREVLTAASAEAAREAIGAGTSNLALGTTDSTAAAGNHTTLLLQHKHRG